MKLSTGLILYMAGGVAGAALLLFSQWAGYGGPVLLLLWLLGAGLYLFWQVRAFEKGLSLLPDMGKFNDYAKTVRSTSVKRKLQKIESLQQIHQKQLSASVFDRNTYISTLQGQINPHFLYNTLECIRSEAITQGNDSIAQMSQALALFFRYSISKKENIVPLQDELDNIRNYFLIQNYRFDEKFEYVLAIDSADDDILDCLVPKMTIQPIVENCIFHGLETKPGKGKVTIRVSMSDKNLMLMISDDGIGIEPGHLRQMQEQLSSDAEEGVSAGSGHGIALQNVNRRIKLHFGAEYGLHIYSTPQMGTDVEVCVPVSYQ